MAAGWVNVVSGLLLRGEKKDDVLVVIVIVVVCLQAVGLNGWVFWTRKKRAGYTPKPSWTKAEDDTFALSTSDDENDEDEDDGAKDEASEAAALRGNDWSSPDEK